jgi:hypothetical protein
MEEKEGNGWSIAIKIPKQWAFLSFSNLSLPPTILTGSKMDAIHSKTIVMVIIKCLHPHNNRPGRVAI